MTAEPPLSAGAVQERLIWLVPCGVAVSPVGLPGTAASVVAESSIGRVGALAHVVDGVDAVVAGGRRIQPHVGVGQRNPRGGQGGPGATGVGPPLDPVAGDGGPAVVAGGGPGQVDLVLPLGRGDEVGGGVGDRGDDGGGRAGGVGGLAIARGVDGQDPGSGGWCWVAAPSAGRWWCCRRPRHGRSKLLPPSVETWIL